MVKQVIVREHERCRIRCRALIGYKEFDVTNSVSTQLILNRQVQTSDRINSDRQSGSDQLGSTRIVSDHEKNNELNEIETFTYLKVNIPVKNGPN